MKDKIEKLGFFYSNEILRDKINEVIDYLNIEPQGIGALPPEKQKDVIFVGVDRVAETRKFREELREEIANIVRFKYGVSSEYNEYKLADHILQFVAELDKMKELLKKYDKRQ